MIRYLAIRNLAVIESVEVDFEHSFNILTGETGAGKSILVEAVGLFANNNLPDLAHKYALEGIKFNPDYFDAWRMLYSIPQSTNEEKLEAKKNLIRLDPLNKEWKALP